MVGTSTDLTASIGVGDRIWLSQSGNQYFIVVAISSSTMTLYGGTTYSLTGSAISSPYYSHAKTPIGFNPSPILWTEQIKSTSDQTQNSPVSGTWYNIGTISLDIPIGIWNIQYSVGLQGNTTTSVTLQTTLSTTNNGASDVDFSTVNQANGSAAVNYMASEQKNISLAAKTTYYLNERFAAGSSTALTIVSGTYGLSALVRAVCALL